MSYILLPIAFELTYIPTGGLNYRRTLSGGMYVGKSDTKQAMEKQICEVYADNMFGVRSLMMPFFAKVKWAIQPSTIMLSLQFKGGLTEK